MRHYREADIVGSVITSLPLTLFTILKQQSCFKTLFKQHVAELRFLIHIRWCMAVAICYIRSVDFAEVQFEFLTNKCFSNLIVCTFTA